MKRKMLIVSFAAFVLSFCVMAFSGPTPDIVIMDRDDVGKYLAYGSAMPKALYTFKKDAINISNCTGKCAEKWPPVVVSGEDMNGKPLTVKTLSLEDPLKNKDFSEIKRKDGKKQLCYKGKPLYFFSEDSTPNDYKGHNVNKVWFLVKP